ncbi:hypothetical protein [Methanoculleus sp. 10]|uniref:hypothetical protein n=1 Tax=Methanoculleus sp. 10 TaxID=430615 RepID=UPI0025EEBD37|nr:hypothetical protein [Methanoculleus sp. 10]
MAYNYTPGDRRTFICTNFVTNEDYIVNATCVGIGEHCYVFVEEGWPLAQREAADLMNAFDHTIYPVVTATFGNETGVDRDPRVYIVLLDIRDDSLYNSTSAATAGYFDGSTKNKIDVVFLDIDQWGTKRKSTLAHEYQHLIHHSHDAHERTWISEGCSEYAELLCFGTQNRANVRSFTRLPDTPLVVTDSQWHHSDDETTGAHYGASFLWILYLAENYGDRSGYPGHEVFLKDLVANELPGMQGVTTTLAGYGFAESFEDVFKRWVVANYLDADGANPPFGYAGIDITRYPQGAGWVNLSTQTVSSHSFPEQELLPWSAAYYEVGTRDPGLVSYTNDRGFWMEKVVNRDGEAVIVVSPLEDRGAFVLTVSEEAGNRSAGTAANGTPPLAPAAPGVAG